MKRTLLLLAVLSACGGKVSSVDQSPSSPESEASPAPGISPAPGPSGGTEPVPGDAPLPHPTPSPWVGATVITLRASTPSAAPVAGNPCGEEWSFTLATGALARKSCTIGANGDKVIDTGTVTTPDDGEIRSAFASLHIAPMPASCAYDGKQYMLTVDFDTGSSRSFADEDYNCYHRKDIEYVSPSLWGLASALEKAYAIAP